MTSFDPFFDFMRFLRYVGWILFVVIILLLSTCGAFGQITYSPEEVRQLAEQNLQRKECLEVNQILEQELDSMIVKDSIKTMQLELKDSMIVNFRSVVDNYQKIDQIRSQQSKKLIEENNDQRNIIKKQNRRLNFWRIFTPITVTATAILGLFL